MMICWGINHTVASVAQRSQVAVPKGLLPRWLRGVRAAGCAEVVILSTCNRTEVYGVCAEENDDAARGRLIRAMTDCAPAAMSVLQDVGYWHSNYAALVHLFRVASSLDAMVVGEPQILGQVKRAYEAACAIGAVGPCLHHLFQRAFRVARRVREQTGLGERPVSIGSVAVALATQLFGDLTTCRALILGSGEMGEDLLRYLQSAEVRNLFISGRPSERLTAIATRAEATIIPWSEWTTRLSEMDIVICSTGAAEPLLTGDHITAIQRTRAQRPLFLIDLAMPRNIDPACAACDHTYVYNLDDLQAIAAENRTARQSSVETAEAMILAMAQKAWQTLHSEHHAVVSSLHQKCERIRQQEVERTLQQLGSTDPTLAATLDRCTHAIVAKLLHDPIVAVKTEGSSLDATHDHTPVAWLRRLFRLA